jgi:MFS family permease
MIRRQSVAWKFKTRTATVSRRRCTSEGRDFGSLQCREYTHLYPSCVSLENRLAISLFVTNLEIPIVTTSLVAIANDLGNAKNVGWVISSYLLGYVGILVIFAKLSDILGRKFMMSASLFLFIVFSGGCGASENFVQL